MPTGSYTCEGKIPATGQDQKYNIRITDLRNDYQVLAISVRDRAHGWTRSSVAVTTFDEVKKSYSICQGAFGENSAVLCLDIRGGGDATFRNFSTGDSLNCTGDF